MLMKARYDLQEKHSRKQEQLADMRASVETEVDVPGNPTCLAYGRCYIFHIQIFLLAEVSTVWATHLDKLC
jgi:hypothetical protein